MAHTYIESHWESMLVSRFQDWVFDGVAIAAL